MLTDLVQIRRLGEKQREENLRQFVIGRNFDIGEGDQSDARILQLEPDDIREVALHLFRDAAAAGVISRHGLKFEV